MIMLTLQCTSCWLPRIQLTNWQFGKGISIWLPRLLIELGYKQVMSMTKTRVGGLHKIEDPKRPWY